MTASVTFVSRGQESYVMSLWFRPARTQGTLLHRFVGAEPAPAAGGTDTRCGLHQVQDLHRGGLKVLRPGWAR